MEKEDSGISGASRDWDGHFLFEQKNFALDSSVDGRPVVRMGVKTTFKKLLVSTGLVVSTGLNLGCTQPNREYVTPPLSALSGKVRAAASLCLQSSS